MKTAVVFYSNSENCSFVAGQIGEITGADLIRLHLVNEEKHTSRRGKIFAAFAMLFFNKKPVLKPFDFDPSAYDLIVIGAPVWAGSPASPIRAFLSGCSITGKKLAIFVCHAGGENGALAKFKTMLAGNSIIAEKDFAKAAANGEKTKNMVATWVQDFAKA